MTRCHLPAQMVVATILALLATCCSAQTVLYVATDGDDASAGTRERPLASLTKAQQVVREKLAAGLEGNVLVLIRGGVYELSEPLRFGPEDCAQAPCWVMYSAYPGERVVISGGRRISGWQPDKDGVWSATLPAVAEGKWRFRQLYSGQGRAIRARTPNANEDAPYWTLADAQMSPDLERYALMFKPGCLEHWADAPNVEAVVKGDWGICRQRVQSVDVGAGAALLAPPHVSYKAHRWNRPRGGRACFLENSRAFLDTPGEWHLDTEAGRLSYIPHQGEHPRQADLIAPVSTGLLQLEGTPEHPVRCLHFSGLRFLHTAWELPDDRYLGMQACWYTKDNDRVGKTTVDAALSWQHACNCSLVECVVGHIGGTGLYLAQGCSYNVIEGCELQDIGGNGIMVGGENTVELVNRGNRIANNHVRRCGAEFYGAVGIWVGYARGTQVSHNLVHDLPYTGISVGWCWAPIPTQVRDNLIEYNHIHDVMREVGDGGGIYTLGLQPGTVLRGNVIHDVRRHAQAHGAPNNGMFIDQGSKSFLFEDNVIFGTAGAPVRFNQCRRDWHTWVDNIYSVARAVEGKIGKAFAADGAGSHIGVAHSATLEPETLTLEAWVYLDEQPSGHDARKWVAGKNTNEWARGHYGLVVSNAFTCAYMNIGGGQAECYTARTDAPLALAAWHHLAMSYDGTTLRLYVDGAQAASCEIGKKRIPGKGQFSIGRRPDAYTHFRGRIDEVRLYDRPLSAEQLRRHHASPEDAAQSGAVLARSFEDLQEGMAQVDEALDRAGPRPVAGRGGTDAD